MQNCRGKNLLATQLDAMLAFFFSYFCSCHVGDSDNDYDDGYEDENDDEDHVNSVLAVTA